MKESFTLSTCIGFLSESTGHKFKPLFSFKKQDMYQSAAVSLEDRVHLMKEQNTHKITARHIMQVSNTQNLALVTHSKGLVCCCCLVEGIFVWFCFFPQLSSKRR